MIKKYFHKIAYRIYNIGKNIDLENKSKQMPQGLSCLSKTDKLKLGNEVSFGGEVMILGGGSTGIGNSTMIGAGTIIHTSTHDYQSHPMNEKRIDKDVNIGEHVWIGTGCIILPGVNIGSFSVIAAGSVVTRDVDEGTIMAGVPARVIGIRNKSIYK